MSRPVRGSLLPVPALSWARRKKMWDDVKERAGTERERLAALGDEKRFRAPRRAHPPSLPPHPHDTHPWLGWRGPIRSLAWSHCRGQHPSSVQSWCYWPWKCRGVFWPKVIIPDDAVRIWQFAVSTAVN
ncbi:hypothetical protein GGTG_10327 [Gaeumannomyces tritici R3-111a-1]|uniref:Uncharacterized protein n=1 Tax=Gaeumannomyces tritici (strain R3-111a-1) TaxID=644352 RepID=J3PA03_GAET3|nr:hypothetical protein GGTG_10327 [Gaeumannomyces tritici R3-111a-1]EJT73489.1 hypothetical protein GGTG_10327 [Gaeumannomyces tritici R3-111a-1]